MILVSACLAGKKCSWDAGHRLNPKIRKMVTERKAIAVCPEVLGGRSVPRIVTEIRGGDGHDVLSGKARVFDKIGKDVTDEFVKGAYMTLEMAKGNNITSAILKSKSPSCGVGRIYDGTFKGKLIKGDGVTTALLKKKGFICELCQGI